MFNVDLHCTMVHMPRTSIKEHNTIPQQVKPVSIAIQEIVYSDQYSNLTQKAIRQLTLDDVI